MEKIAFIGMGVMGGNLARRLREAGYPMQVFEIDPKKAEALVALGAVFCPTVKDVVQGADVVISMLGYPKDVESVYFGENGVMENAKPGALLIDMTTSSPALAIRIEQAAKARGLMALDAPVSGGPTGAAAGTLSIMVGGDTDAFERAAPYFAIMGKTITHTGGAGMGQNTKMANQIAVGCNVAAVAEAFAYAKATGLDPGVMFTCVSGGAGGSWQMTNMASKMVEGDDDPGFFIRHLIKDMDILLGEATAHDVELPLIGTVRRIYGELSAKGMDNCGTQAVYHYYDK